MLAGVSARVALPAAERYMSRQVDYLTGGRAEEAVGMTLNELRHEGWIVMHDIERAGEGNLDHLVSGPGGVFLIETKARRYVYAHLPRVKRQAARLHDELDVWVTPVICIHQRAGAPWRASGVSIVPGGQLLAWLRAQRNATVDFDRLARFADSL